MKTLILLTTLLATFAANAQTFHDLGGDGDVAKVSESGRWAVVHNGNDCEVIDLAATPPTTTTVAIPAARTLLECRQIQDLASGSWGLVANVYETIPFLPETYYRTAVDPWLQMAAGVNARTGGLPKQSTAPHDIAFAGQGFDTATSRSLPLWNLTGTPEFVDSTASVDIQTGAWESVTESGSIAVGWRTFPLLGLATPLFGFGDGSTLPIVSVSSQTSGTFLFDVIDAAPPMDFVAVGYAEVIREVDKNGTVPIFGTVDDAYMYPGFTDRPTWLTAIDGTTGPCESRALTIGHDFMAGGESCGIAVLWNGDVPFAVDRQIFPHRLDRPLAGSSFDGVVPTGWVLEAVTDVALDTDVYVGRGTFNGTPANFALDMQAIPVPEPSVPMTLAVGLFCLIAVGLASKRF